MLLVQTVVVLRIYRISRKKRLCHVRQVTEFMMCWVMDMI